MDVLARQRVQKAPVVDRCAGLSSVEGSEPGLRRNRSKVFKSGTAEGLKEIIED